MLALALPVGCSGDGADKTTAETAPHALIGSTWLAKDIDGQSVLNRAPSTITFDSESRVVDSGGCNRYVGSVALKDGVVKFGHLAATRKACVPAWMDQERRFFDALAATRSYRFEGSHLVFHNGGRGALIRFGKIGP